MLTDADAKAVQRDRQCRTTIRGRGKEVERESESNPNLAGTVWL